MGILQGKVAIVTGGAAGIGKATALALAHEGASVAVVDVDGAGASETADAIRATGGDATSFGADVSDSAAVSHFVDEIVGAWGGLDIAFNNAGTEGAPAPTAECTEENWARTIAVDLTGTWLCMRAEIPHMLARGGGVIVNCASIAGLVGFPALPAYVASKHGVVGLTRSAALDYAQSGLRINAVCPGVIHTAMVERFTHGNAAAEAELTSGEPMGRMGTPEEIAAAVLWLVSDGSSFVTGQALAVDGGWTAR
jgi:NAD(P)-dependent dehydrogenase (short-subunit alcohol dehydrogenase family)